MTEDHHSANERIRIDNYERGIEGPRFQGPNNIYICNKCDEELTWEEMQEHNCMEGLDEE